MQSARERLRQWIERSKLSQREAAELLGFDQTYLSQILNGKRNPGLDNAVKIEERTGVTVKAWASNDLSGPSGDESAVGANPQHGKA
jgi:transcriptional regulator with XRE-family HTH domain